MVRTIEFMRLCSAYELLVICGGKMAPIDAIWLFLVKMEPLPTTALLPARLPPRKTASSISYASKKLSKMAGIQLAIYFIVECVDRL